MNVIVFTGGLCSVSAMVVVGYTTGVWGWELTGGWLSTDPVWSGEGGGMFEYVGDTHGSVSTGRIEELFAKVVTGNSGTSEVAVVVWVTVLVTFTVVYSTEVGKVVVCFEGGFELTFGEGPVVLFNWQEVQPGPVGNFKLILLPLESFPYLTFFPGLGNCVSQVSDFSVLQSSKTFPTNMSGKSARDAFRSVWLRFMIFTMEQSIKNCWLRLTHDL